jgi:y4mF family transcriptional regulator
MFPSGNISSSRAARDTIFPEREIYIDIPQQSMIISRTVNIMARRTLTTAEIGDIVRTTRKAAGLRQDQLAGAAGVGLRFIVDLEAGKPTAQIGKTLQVLAALGCSLDIAPPPEPKGARTA